MTLCEARTQKGMTQGQLAKKLKVTQSAVARWEAGANPPLEKYHKDIARILQVPANEIDELKERSK